jgi:hypothetical protein
MDTVIDTTYWKEWCWHCTHWNGTTCDDSTQTRDTCAVDFPTSDPKNWDFILVDTVEAFTGSIDTVGTLISGWEQVDSRAVSTGDLGLDIKITGIADKSQPTGHIPPIHPQQGGVLIKLLADIFPIPDTQLDREVGILVDVAWKPYFVFSTPEGEAIGWVSVPVPDTNYYMCTSPEPPPGTGCYVWTKVHKWECPEGICDKVEIDTIEVAELDDTQVKVINGKITVSSWLCGDCNGLGLPPHQRTISDISLLVDHLFINHTPIVPLARCNTNCSTEVPMRLTIGDVAALVDRLFVSGRKLCCEP